MASEGTRFTSFYVAQAVCTASRAALMTGCYANRVSMSGALNHTSRTGIHPDEVLLPEVCKSRGYATAIFGKWHLGTLAEFVPLRNGFDEYIGIPYSNDNSKYHPIIRNMPPLPLYDGEEVIETDPDQSQFTRRSRIVRLPFCGFSSGGVQPNPLVVARLATVSCQNPFPLTPQCTCLQRFCRRTSRSASGDGHIGRLRFPVFHLPIFPLSA